MSKSFFKIFLLIYISSIHVYVEQNVSIFFRPFYYRNSFVSSKSLTILIDLMSQSVTLMPTYLIDNTLAQGEKWLNKQYILKTQGYVSPNFLTKLSWILFQLAK